MKPFVSFTFSSFLFPLLPNKSNRKNPWDAIAQNIKSVLVNGDTLNLQFHILIQH
jgi:hypothetical protein